LQIFHKEQTNGPGISFSVAAWFPARQGLESQKQFKMPNWGESRITWTMMPPANPSSRSTWKSRDHFSTLPYGWIPDDGVDFFTQFILCLKERWLKLCDLAEKHLSDRVS
jgi:hypothetical protein